MIEPFTLTNAMLAVRIICCLTYPLAVLDVMSTNAALNKPGTKEGNPIERAAMWLLGTRWPLFRFGWNQAGVYFALRHGGDLPWYAVLTLALGAAVTAYAVWSNGRYAGWWK